MNGFSPKNRRFFENCGRRGGQVRSRRLSPVERTSIASRAALARWSSQGSSSLMKSVRLDQPNLEDPVYLEELLLEGSLEDWRRLYQKIMNEPFGSTAQTLQRTLSSTHIYGVTALWKGIFRGLQGNFL